MKTLSIEAQEQICALCQSSVHRQACLDNDLIFCCAGCQAVYQILSTQQVKTHFHEHPLFLRALQSGLISNPHLLEQARSLNQELNVPNEEFIKLHLEINQMWCPSCAELIRLVLLKEKGIRNCIVDYSTDLAVIEYTPRYLSKEKIFRLIEQLGYDPRLLQDQQQQVVNRTLYLRFIVAAFFALNLMMFAYPLYASYFHAEDERYLSLFSWLSLVGALPVLGYSAWPIWRRLYMGLKVGIWGMEMLVFIGVSAATLLSIYEMWQHTYYVYFDSMTVIIAFVLLGKIIESRAKFSAKDSLLRLTRSLPRRGRKAFPDGTTLFVPLKEIQPDDQIVILLGEKVVLDGIVEEGEGACDESLMTGESLPVPKKMGSSVLAGSFLQQGRLIIRVTSNLEESALYRIIEMVEKDIGHKSSSVRVVDQIVKWFVPVVCLLAFATALFCVFYGIQDRGSTVIQTALTRAISILLISCPCAIGIAVPLAESHVLNALAKLGVIVRNRGSLPYLGKETIFIFDKTGTITEGKFTVLKGLEHLSFEDQTSLKGLVCNSTHPLCVAINQSLLVLAAQFDFVEEIVGRGIRGGSGEDTYYLGSEIFFVQQGIQIPFSAKQEELTEQVETRVFFAKNREYISCFRLGDRIRSEAKEVVHQLKLERVNPWLVSGDSQLAVKSVAEKCDFGEWHAGCHPLQKREIIEELRGRKEVVTMLGDGINDAPSLTAAHVGIAVVSAADISIQVSDILLTTDRLSALLKMRQIAKKGHRIIKQNLFWAFFYNVIGIGLAIGGVLSPLFAAFAMVSSSLIVLLNAQRVHRHR